MATDEGVLGRSLGMFFARDGNGRLPADLAEKLYTIHRYENGQTRDEPDFPRPHDLGPDWVCIFGNAAAGRCQHLIHNIKRSRATCS